MDEFSAHLDRGWDLAQRGDSAGAELSARRALELDAHSPEAYNLLGYVSALQGDYEDAVEQYEQAIALDETYLEAMLNAAELYIHPLGELEQALSLCERAMEYTETEEEVLDVMLLRFDAYRGLNDEPKAREVARRFPKGPFENPQHAFLVGRAYFELGELELARPLLEQAASTPDAGSDVHYYFGQLLDALGNVHGATQALLRARELDFEIPSPPWTLSADTFVMTAKRAVEALSAELRAFLRLDELYVADVPGVEVVVDGVDPHALVLLDGLVQDERTSSVTARVFVYQRNVERTAGAVAQVQEEIREALEREIRFTFIENDRAQPEPKGALH